MIDKNPARLRRARQTRLKIREIGAVRLTVGRFTTEDEIDRAAEALARACRECS